jgi:zinc transport system ATP-binding protein
MTPPPLVTARGLCVRLGGHDILRGVDADVLRGRVTALLGLNGSGKTTLLRALVREVPYTGGLTFHCGHDHSRPAPEHVGYVPQRLRVEANLPLTVYDLFGLTLQRWPLFFGVKAHVRRRAEELLARIGRPDLLHAEVRHLSGGEMQRVLLALALEPDPELLLLDEPAAGIDFAEKQKFYDLIGDLNARTGVTVLLVSHDLVPLGRVAHQVLCLDGGRVVCAGPTQEVLHSESLARAFGLHGVA